MAEFIIINLSFYRIKCFWTVRIKGTDECQIVIMVNGNGFGL